MKKVIENENKVGCTKLIAGKIKAHVWRNKITYISSVIGFALGVHLYRGKERMEEYTAVMNFHDIDVGKAIADEKWADRHELRENYQELKKAYEIAIEG